MADEIQPLTPAAFEILLSLADTDRHGYAIMREVAERTGERVQLRAGTLYRAVDRMLKAGWLEERDPPAAADRDDDRRRYYRLTPLGREVLLQEVKRLEEVLAAARETALVRNEASR